MLVLFFTLRPINEPAYRIIAADGLGYYSYLPAKFIYNDADFNFNWFDDVFNRHYHNDLFARPIDNFMVKFGDKSINKYYPGQSLLQLPFFLAAHATALLFNFEADGFSVPYQVAMGLSALFYAWLGLLFTSAVLMNLYNNKRLALFVPLIIFFGTNLFTYSIFYGCYSHVYSFCLIALAFYATQRFFNMPQKTIYHLLPAVLFSLIVLTIRPLNAFLLVSLLFFYKPFKISELFVKSGSVKIWISILVLILFVLFYNLQIIYTQTGSWVINTYVGEKFYLNNWQHIFDNFFGFQYGMLWYTPLVLLCFLSIFFIRKNLRLLFLLLPLLFLIMLYSFWWYWNIVARVIVDSSVIFAILLSVVFVYTQNNKRVYTTIMIMALLCIPFFQLKAFQLRNGIIDSNYTYSKYYAKYFFTVHQINVYPVRPSTIIKRQSFFSDFESEQGAAVSTENKFEGNQSAVLNKNNEFAGSVQHTLTPFFNETGFKKIRAAFWLKKSQNIADINLVFNFKAGNKAQIYKPFYLNNALKNDHWHYLEFGIDLPVEMRAGDTLDVYFWNPRHSDEAYIDNLKLEFLLTDGSDEITLK